MLFLEMRHGSATVFVVFFGFVLRKVYGFLCLFGGRLGRILSLVPSQHISSESNCSSNKYEHLQYGCNHARLLSTSMPSHSKVIPTKNISRNTSHRCLLGSKSSYMGAKTKTRIPASRRASPPISAVFSFSDKVTSVPGEGALYHRLNDYAVSLSKVSTGAVIMWRSVSRNNV